MKYLSFVSSSEVVRFTFIENTKRGKRIMRYLCQVPLYENFSRFRGTTALQRKLSFGGFNRLIALTVYWLCPFIAGFTI